MYGFVYLLGNRAMPRLFKIGCTEGSPYARARALSGATGVPRSFDVLAYIEVANHRFVERKFHDAMTDFRANSSREFFRFGHEHMNWLYCALRHYPDAVGFASPCWDRYANTPSFPDDYEETWIDDGDLLMPPASPPIDGSPYAEVAVE